MIDYSYEDAHRKERKLALAWFCVSSVWWHCAISVQIWIDLSNLYAKGEKNLIKLCAKKLQKKCVISAIFVQKH
jgi:hypothetical protein